MLAQPLGFVPSVAYSLLVYVMNLHYLHLAHRLTEWENHRTEEQFDRHVVTKLVLFEFINSFLALFYIAFYLGDVALLKSQVFMMLLVQQVMNQVQETVLPILMHKPSTRKMFNKVNKRMDDTQARNDIVEHGEVSILTKLASDDPQVERALFALRKEPYESTYDDFVELWLQFGGVFLFSCVYPLAAFLALANNVLELKLDAYKLCKFARKPTPRSMRDIGAWYTALDLMSLIAISTNCALLAMDVDLRRSLGFQLSDVNWILLFVGLEHVFLAVRMAIDQLIPDTSEEVKRAIDREDFILKNQGHKKLMNT